MPFVANTRTNMSVLMPVLFSPAFLRGFKDKVRFLRPGFLLLSGVVGLAVVVARLGVRVPILSIPDTLRLRQDPGLDPTI